jgi:hypothetical protein
VRHSTNSSLCALLAALVYLIGSHAALAGPVTTGAGTRLAIGERIFREGILPSGGLLKGERFGAESVEGPVAACVGCHRRSGLGSGEGSIRIAPITARYLFREAGVPAGLPTLSAQAASVSARVPYDDESLANAIRHGVGRDGRQLNYLMPRYLLDESNMASLIGYLKSLPTTASPGVSDSTIDLATIVTPDADPAARDGMLAVLNQFVEDKNAFIRGGRKSLLTQEQIGFRVTRRWRLHVWTLEGGADTWEDQLRAHLKAEPVFAVLSGIGGRSWAPVHRFCERVQLPCLFPNVDLPVDAQRDFYSIYFSKGVLLEAELLAARFQGADQTRTGGRIIEVYEKEDSAEAAADKLRTLVAANNAVVTKPIPPGDAAALANAVSEARPDDSLVLWLRPASLASLRTAPPLGTAVYLSGTLAGLEHAPLPAAWRSVARLTYPVDLPAARALRMTYPLRWLQIHHIPVVSERVQADTYLACGIVAQSLSEMLDSFMRDYLIERIESMLSQRQLSGYYPRLGVGTGQRFASKGGFFVHFEQSSGTEIAADGDWVVP